MLAALSPEVGADFFDQALFHPAIDDGLHYRRLIVRETQGHEVFFRELLGQGIQIADVSLGSLHAQSTIVQEVDLVAVDLQLVV